MRIKTNGPSNWLGFAGYLLLGAFFATGILFLRESRAAPVLKITSLTSSNVSLWITNGASTNFYEVFGHDTLTPPARISLTKTGTLGQTNFTIDRGSELSRFFKAAVNNDWDGDGILNVFDADPRNTNVGLLTITIRTPTNGANIQ